MRQGRRRNALFLPSLYIFVFFTSSTLADDATAMKELLKALSPPPPGWSESDPCKWSGVVCDSSSGRVTEIYLSAKSLSGTLPQNLNQLTELHTLSLKQNKLSGPVPSFAKLSNLEKLYLEDNEFTSVPPNCFSGLTRLQTLTLSENPKMNPWGFPQELRDSKSLVDLDASKCNMMGPLPDIFATLTSLQSLTLSYNNLTGPIPMSLAKTAVQNLSLNNQDIGMSGGIDVLGNMSHLSQAWLHKNAFSGGIPDLSKCTNLVDIKLRDNQLTGVIPPSLISLPKLRGVSLASNKFQGPFPEFGKDVIVELGNENNFCNIKPGPCDPQVTTLLKIVGDMNYPMKLSDSWRGNDACQGWPFVTCDAQKKSITVINFSKQRFSGKISPAYGDLTSLTELVLSENNLTGPIPDSLTKLSKLEVLDVSNNNLSEKVPEFSSSVKVIKTGNKMLGIVTITTTTITTPTTTSGGTGGSPKKLPLAIVAGIVTAIVVSTIVACVVVLGRRHARKHPMKFSRIGNKIEPDTSRSVCDDEYCKESKESTNEIESTIDPKAFQSGHLIMPFQILQQVTNNFSDKNILGEGGFGTVYKGILHDGTQIAVKRMQSSGMSSQGLREFGSEIEVLSKVRHRNLVGLLGFCVNNNERLLVYEYMPQGTLGDNLFEWRENGKNPLTWNQRAAIALDVARGVEYLHTLANESFIHRDLKASNVLLGDDMRAKVSDFGLVKTVAPGGKRSIETKLAGTFGYLAPEYASTGKVSTKVDVFAFGAVLMELITGRRALDEEREDSHLVTWFRKVMINKDAVRSSIDPTLEPADEAFESIKKVISLAGYCTSREAGQRPDMSHAVNVLSSLVEYWAPSNDSEDDQCAKLNTSLTKCLQRWKENEDSSQVDDWWPDEL